MLDNKPHFRAVMKSGDPILVSIIVPVLDEEDVLHEFYDRLQAAVRGLSAQIEIVFVNDGSTDSTSNILKALQQHDERILVVNLSRRFGKEVAISAGLDHAKGDAILFVDADLQDPPECIPDMIEAWQAGYDVVAMQRTDRSSDTWFKRTSATLFYQLLSKISTVAIPQGVGDFRLISQRVADALRQLPERNRYMKGLFAWVGYSYIELPYTRAKRHAGTTKWPFLKLVGLAVDGITAFTISPLRLASVAGVLTSAAAFLYAAIVLVRTVAFGDPVAGYPTLIIAISFLGGVQLLAIGLLGEYVGRMFVETKQRPLYFVDSIETPEALRSGARFHQVPPTTRDARRRQSAL